MGEGLRRVRRVSLVDDVAEQLTRRIISGEWPPGSAIPSLRAFASELGVSTITIREAVRLLQGHGLVETRHGSGTYVRPPEPNEGSVPWMLSPHDADEYLELMEAREFIEGELIRLAMERATPSQVAELSDLVDDMASAAFDAAAFLDADLAFHITLAEAAHNRILLRTMLAIRGPLKRFIANRAVQDLQEVGNLSQPVANHRQIVAALEERDPAAAREALRSIIQRGSDHLTALRASDLGVLLDSEGEEEVSR